MTRILKTLGLVILLTGLTISFSSSVYATNGYDLGGNNSADYQPPTGNPQSSVGSSPQSGTVSLQPAPGQGAMAQQDLPIVANLGVTGANNIDNPNTTSTSVTPAPTKTFQVWPIVVIGIATLLAIIYIVRRPEPTAIETVVDTKPAKPKSKSKTKK